MFCINVWLTVKEEPKAEIICGLLAEVARKSREEPGCLRFEVYRSQADNRRILLVERWESQTAWETHRQAQAFQEIYLPQVLPHVDREPHISTLVE